MNKYGNKKIKAYGLNFDSKKEFDFYNKLVLLKKSGFVKDFKFQFPFKFNLDGKWLFTYKADFVIDYADGSTEVVDIKPLDKKTGKFLTTSTFQLKKKLIEHQNGIKIILK